VTVPNQHPRNKSQKHAQNGSDSAWCHAIRTLESSLSVEHFARVKIVLAVSGGADSVAMLHLVHSLWCSRPDCDPSHLTVAHYNHSLRGDASQADQAFVGQLARELEIPFVTETAPSPASLCGEADFRDARYQFLQRAAESIGARYVFVAHSVDDNVETFLHNLLRGSGPTGLAGIAKHRSLGEQLVLYRPLLELSRKQLRAALRERDSVWREDESNADDCYQRNWIRGKLLPLIRERYPQVDQSLQRTIESQRSIYEQLSEEAKDWSQHSIEFHRDEVQLLRTPIAVASLSVVVQKVWDQMNWPRQNFNNQHLRRLHEVLSKRSSQSFTLPGDIQCHVSDDRVSLRQCRPETL
jgi:tRNA(Ile)-lysidine synthase